MNYTDKESCVPRFILERGMKQVQVPLSSFGQVLVIENGYILHIELGFIIIS